MTFDDLFWQHLEREGVLSAPEAEQARRRHAEVGGSVDLAIFEVKALNDDERRTLLRALARELDRSIAPAALLDHPEAAALSCLMPRVAERHGVLAVEVGPHGLLLVGAVVPASVLAELSYQLERKVTAQLAFEVDVRIALRRHLDLSLPPRVSAVLERGTGHLALGRTTGSIKPIQLSDLPITADEERPSAVSARRRVVKVEPPPDDDVELPTFLPGASRSGPPPDTAAIEAAVDRLRRDVAEDGDMALLVRAGGAGLEALFRIFPGHLRLDRFTIDPALVKPSAHSAVVSAVIRFGPRAVPRLEALFDHVSPELRYYAVCCLSGMHSPGSVDRVAHLLFDKDQAVREMAVVVLERFRRESAFASAAAMVVRALDEEPIGRRRQAAQAAGMLHLTAACGRLIELLPNADAALGEAAHRALVEITRQDFADSAWRWKVWLEAHGDAPRVEWLLQGLLHERRHVRAAALKELQRLTQQTYGFQVDAPPAERKVAADRWLQWWEESGRIQHRDYR
jgi:hypothetical protein